MPDHPLGCEDGEAKHDRRFHKFSGPYAQSRDCPKSADGAEHESGSEHESEIEHASFESFLHGRTSQPQLSGSGTRSSSLGVLSLVESAQWHIFT